MRNPVSGLVLLMLLLATASPAARAQQSQEDRIKALEERIIALEGQVRMLKDQPPAAPAPAATEVQGLCINNCICTGSS